MATIDTGDTFRLRNDHATEDLKVTLNRKVYQVAPGKSALVPFELIRVYWGDPRSRAEIYTKFSDSASRGWINKREDEIARLGNLYGSFALTVEDLNDPDWPHGHEFRGKVPKLVPWPVSIFSEAGEEIIPACFDYTGTKVYAGVSDEAQDLTDAVAYRQHLEERLDQMQNELRRVTGADTQSDAEVDVPAGR